MSKGEPSRHFHPWHELADALLPHVGDVADGSHDIGHILRVWKNVRAIRAVEGGDEAILCAATILHDCVHVEKNSPLRAESSKLSARRARDILQALDWPLDQIDAVAHAIAAHSFSAGIPPTTLEAKVLQDADRLDAIGFVGVARTFYIAGRLGRSLYDPLDPMAADRCYDDERFAIDHFQTKLLRLSDQFQTEAGKGLARTRHAQLQRFLDGFLREL